MQYIEYVETNTCNEDLFENELRITYFDIIHNMLDMEVSQMRKVHCPLYGHAWLE